MESFLPWHFLVAVKWVFIAQLKLKCCSNCCLQEAKGAILSQDSCSNIDHIISCFEQFKLNFLRHLTKPTFKYTEQQAILKTRVNYIREMPLPFEWPVLYYEPVLSRCCSFSTLIRWKESICSILSPVLLSLSQKTVIVYFLSDFHFNWFINTLAWLPTVFIESFDEVVEEGERSDRWSWW